MKATVEDFKDILRGKSNKLDYAKNIIRGLRAIRFTTTVKRRNMSTNPKIYFFVRINNDAIPNKWSRPYEDYIISYISSYFPDAYIVGSSENGMIVAEFK